MSWIRGMDLCNSLQAKMRKKKKHRDKQRHNKNTVFVKCDATTLNTPSQHPPAAAECASVEQLETQR